MIIEILKSKIHRVKVTQAELNYVGSITIDEDLLDAAHIIPNEKLQIVNNNNGERFETYAIKGERGTGLGLSMVYGIVQRADGFMDIRSELNKGTAIHLYFPVLAKDHNDTVQASHSESDSNTARPLSLLLVDDDPNVLAAMTAILEMSGHLVQSANSGSLATQLFNQAARKGEDFDALITDLGMPEMDGKELAEMIKSLSPTTPVLMLTGWGKQMSLNNEEVPQVDMIMAKPPKPAELESALRKLCRK